MFCAEGGPWQACIEKLIGKDIDFSNCNIHMAIICCLNSLMHVLGQKAIICNSYVRYSHITTKLGLSYSTNSEKIVDSIVHYD